MIEEISKLREIKLMERICIEPRRFVFKPEQMIRLGVLKQKMMMEMRDARWERLCLK